MDFPLFLAMTAAEFASCRDFPPQTAYMSCHFSPSGPGLSGTPQWLPPNSVLMITDEIPPNGHDPRQVAQELDRCVSQLKCSAVLLDLQRPALPEAKAIMKAIASLPCPVAVSEPYAKDFDCGVLLSPPPLWTTLSDHLAPWKGRSIWLEAAMDSKAIVISENGCRECTPPLMLAPCKHRDTRLHCSYDITVQPDHVQFSLHRTAEDLQELLEEAEELGITKAIGLYQELGEWFL